VALPPIVQRTRGQGRSRGEGRSCVRKKRVLVSDVTAPDR